MLICGGEVLSLEVPGVETLVHDLATASAATPSTKVYDVALMFANTSTACPISTYSLVGDGAGIAILTENKLSINLSQVGAATFEVEAKTGGGVALSKKFDIKIEDNTVLINNPPKFGGLVGPLLNVELVKGADGELKDTSPIEFKSPIAKDAENDKITMTFDY